MKDNRYWGDVRHNKLTWKRLSHCWHAVTLDVPALAYTHFMIMMMELQKILSQELKYLCIKTTTVLSEWTIPKTMDVCLLHFYCIRNQYIYIYIYTHTHTYIYIPCVWMHVYCIERYIYWIYSRYSHTLYRMRLSIP